MNRIFNIVFDEVDSSPFAPRSKMIAPVVGAALIGAGSSLVSNLLGSASNRSANQTNLEIARMNNEQQYRIFKEQMSYNEDMWNKQNEYNLPKNEVQRLLEAGINPAAVYGNGSITPAGQLQAPSAPSLQQAHVNPFTPDLSGVGEAVNAFFDNQIKNKQIKALGLDNEGKQIDLEFKATQIMLNMYEQLGNIDNKLADTNLKKEQRYNLEKQREDLSNRIEVYKAQMDDLKVQAHKQNDVLDAQSKSLLADATLKRCQAQYQALVTRYYPNVTQAQLKLIGAKASEAINHASLLISEKKLTDKKVVEQILINGLKGFEFHDSQSKHGEFSSNPELMSDIKDFASYLAGLLLDNFRLFK